MIQIRKSNERGHANHGWLEAYHSFSFANYYNPDNMGFRTLRVLNEDRVQKGQGFGTHGHEDMEIVTYILDGALEHKDSMGNGSVIRPGDVQYMSAGSGVTHSEFNPSKTETAHLLQIWILPNAKTLKPRYDQKHFDREARLGKLCLVVSHDGAEGSIAIRQHAKIYASLLSPGQSVEATYKSGCYGYLQVAKGSVVLNGKILEAGDAAMTTEERTLKIENTWNIEAEFLLFDLL